MSIQWEGVSPQEYEHMVSVLLSRLHPNAQRVDGKGGDGGRDVQIVHGQDSQIIAAFELKSFTGRMTPGRKQQVTRSLHRAAALRPCRWTLVVPIDPTPGELEWFRNLRKRCLFPIEWCGKTWLDEKLAAFPDIRRYFLEGAKDEVYQLLLELGKEQARLTDVHDAVGRFKTIHKRLNEIDPYYRYEIATGATGVETWPSDVTLSVGLGDVRVDVYPKYSGAVRDRPVSIHAMVDLGPDDLQIQESLGYGLEVLIPHTLIASLKIDAPSGLGGSFDRGDLHIFPIDTKLDDPVSLGLQIMEGDRLIASWPVDLTERTGGTKGYIFTGTDRTGWLEMRLKLNLVEGKGEAEFGLNPKPAMPTALAPLFRWIDELQPTRHLKIRWPEGFEVRCELGRPFPGAGDIRKVVEALAYLQERYSIYEEIPSSLSNKEAQDIVDTAALLKGESIDLKWKSLNLNLDQWGPQLKELAKGNPQPLIIEQETSLSLQGVHIPIGKIRTYLPSARSVAPESIQPMLVSGLQAPFPLRLVPGDNDEARRVLVSLM